MYYNSLVELCLPDRASWVGSSCGQWPLGGGRGRGARPSPAGSARGRGTTPRSAPSRAASAARPPRGNAESSPQAWGVKDFIYIKCSQFVGKYFQSKLRIKTENLPNQNHLTAKRLSKISQTAFRPSDICTLNLELRYLSLTSSSRSTCWESFCPAWRRCAPLWRKITHLWYILLIYLWFIRGILPWSSGGATTPARGTAAASSGPPRRTTGARVGAPGTRRTTETRT